MSHPSCRAHHVADRLLRALLAALLAVAILPAAGRAAEVDLSAYTYEDTQQLVRLVTDAAALMEQKGEAAFNDFRVPHSRWRFGKYPIFVYAVDGTAVFELDQPQFVGHNEMGLRDVSGRPVVRDITDIARRPEPDASGWVFYRWQEPASLSPAWRATYVRKVTTPDHKVYALGCGIFEPKIERVFVQQNVDKAAALLLREGRGAFQQLSELGFRILGTFIFVMDAGGRMLVDPVFPTDEQRNLWNFTDSSGAHTIQEVLQRLKSADQAWISYLAPPPDSKVAQRRLMYVRKIMLDGEPVFVGSDFRLTVPIWMRVENDSAWPRDPPA